MSKESLKRLEAAINAFIEAADDEITRLGFDGCPSDPCPYCTAGMELQSAILNLEEEL